MIVEPDALINAKANPDFEKRQVLLPTPILLPSSAVRRGANPWPECKEIVQP